MKTTEYNTTCNSYNKNSVAFVEQWKDTNNIDSGKIEAFIALLPQGAKILDVGAGFGKDVHYLNSRGYDCIGIDFCDEFIAKSKELYNNVHIVKMNFTDIDFLDNSFDGLWSRGALFHISKADFSNVIKKLSKMLKNGGVFYIQMIEGLDEGMQSNIGNTNTDAYYAYYTNSELQEIMSNNGFTYIKDYPVEGWLNHFYRLSK